LASPRFQQLPLAAGSDTRPSSQVATVRGENLPKRVLGGLTARRPRSTSHERWCVCSSLALLPPYRFSPEVSEEAELRSKIDAAARRMSRGPIGSEGMALHPISFLRHVCRAILCDLRSQGNRPGVGGRAGTHVQEGPDGRRYVQSFTFRRLPCFGRGSCDRIALANSILCSVADCKCSER
jgi:hypothetical protein